MFDACRMMHAIFFSFMFSIPKLFILKFCLRCLLVHSLTFQVGVFQIGVVLLGSRLGYCNLGLYSYDVMLGGMQNSAHGVLFGETPLHYKTKRPFVIDCRCSKCYWNDKLLRVNCPISGVVWSPPLMMPRCGEVTFQLIQVRILLKPIIYLL